MQVFGVFFLISIPLLIILIVCYQDKDITTSGVVTQDQATQIQEEPDQAVVSRQKIQEDVESTKQLLQQFEKVRSEALKSNYEEFQWVYNKLSEKGNRHDAISGLSVYLFERFKYLCGGKAELEFKPSLLDAFNFVYWTSEEQKIYLTKLSKQVSICFDDSTVK